MSDIEREDATNDLEVEITDLDPKYEGGKVVEAWWVAQNRFARIRWRQVRASMLRIVLLFAIFLVPLMIGFAYNTRTQTISALECVRQPKIVYVSKETVTSSDTTLTITISPEQPPDNPHYSYVVSGLSKVSPSTCK